MILTDSVSCLLHAHSDDLMHFEDIPENKDPDYFFDLKKLFRQKEDHWKNVKQYRKTHFKENHENKYRMDGEINYIKDVSDLYHQDIEWFCRGNPHMNAGEAAQAFCAKYRGYANVYGVEFVRRAIVREIESHAYSKDL